MTSKWLIIHLFCIILLISSILRDIFRTKDKNQILLKVNSASFSVIFHIGFGCIVLFTGIVGVLGQDSTYGIRDLSLGLMFISLGVKSYKGYYISKKGVVIDSVLYEWDKIRSWEFENSGMNKISLKLDEKNIDFIVYEEYNEKVEELLNKYIVQNKDENDM